MPPASSPAPVVVLSYRVEPPYDRWVLDDDPPMPASNPHREAVRGLEQALRVWAARHRPRALVGGSLAIRWDRERPQVGVDPDVYLVDPAPPEGPRVQSLLLWQHGHRAPQLAIEVVSATNAKKDYVEAPAKYAACGVGELWVFDADLAGPALGGGPHRLQLWRRDGRGRFRRAYGGPGPFPSPLVGAWLVVVEADEGRQLRLADDPAGRSPWPTEAELARSEGHAEGRFEGHAEGRAEGEARGLGPLCRQFERRLGRALNEAERAELGRRLGALGPERLGDVVLDLTPDELGAWIGDVAAR